MIPTTRPAQPSDRDEWLRMRHALWPHHAPPRLAVDIDRYFAAPGNTVVFVSPRPGGGLQGFVEGSIRSYAEGCVSNNVGYVEGWYVDADVRRQGVGAALIAAVEAWARSQGCTEMGSDTPLSNTVSQAAHSRLGYGEAKRLVHFKKML